MFPLIFFNTCKKRNTQIHNKQWLKKPEYTDKLISQTLPNYAIISVGEPSEYDLPSEKTLDILEKQRLRYYTTGAYGNIIFDYNKGEIPMPLFERSNEE